MKRPTDRMPPNVAPEPFVDANGNTRGWRVRLPEGRPLATPAVVDGRVLLGAGFGSYEFLALDAETGALEWCYQTADDGPTAAVVDEGHVVFNTESCELEVLSLEGESIWKKWLGDPLMSTPAIDEGRIFMAYPDSKGDRRHYLAAFDLRTGRSLWSTPIPGEVITTPVVSQGHVYVATLDGTIACHRAEDGATVRQEEERATSSPVVVDGFCYFSQREEVTSADALHAQSVPIESCSTSSPIRGTRSRSHDSTRRRAHYLDVERRRTDSVYYRTTEVADAGVGFAGGKGDAKIEQASRNIGHDHVASVWAYQGSKPFFWNDHLYSAPGDTLQSLSVDSGEVAWSSRLTRSEEEAVVDHLLTPPAIVNGKLFLGTAEGDLVCVSAVDGTEQWRLDLGEPIVFQPAVVGGRVYVSSGSGSIFSIETGDPNDDGWHMWGATPAHNGLHELEPFGKAEDENAPTGSPESATQQMTPSR